MTDNITTIMKVLENNFLLSDIQTELHRIGFPTSNYHFVRGYLESMVDNGTIRRFRLGKNKVAYTLLNDTECIGKRCPVCRKHIVLFNSNIGNTIQCISCNSYIEICTSLSKGVVLKVNTSKPEVQ